MVALTTVKAQLSIPTLWETEVTYQSPDRIDAAKCALIQGVKRLKGPNWRFHHDLAANRPSFYAVLASFDIMTTQKRFSDLSLHFHSACASEIKPYSQVPPDVLDMESYAQSLRLTVSRQFGYSLMRAYKAYGNPNLVDIAKNCWEIANQYTISSRTTWSGKMATKNFTIVSKCDSQGVPTKGAVFQNFSRADGWINGYETAYFFLLSAMLADSEATPNSTYLLAAQESLDFLSQSGLSQEVLLSGASQSWLAIDVTTKPDCHFSVNPDPQAPWDLVSTSTAGLMIEGLSILTSLTHGSHTRDLLQRSILTIYNQTTRGWPEPTGVLTYYEGENGRLHLVRGLAEAYRRNTLLSLELRQFIKAFLGVQYNAVRNQASLGDGLYAGSWIGPVSEMVSFDPHNQSSAAQVLVDGIDLFGDTSKPSPPVEVITGSIVGVVVFLVSSGLAIYTFLRRRKRLSVQDSCITSQVSFGPSLMDPKFEITPFFDSQSDVLPFARDPPQGASGTTSLPPHCHTKDRSVLGQQNPKYASNNPTYRLIGPSFDPALELEDLETSSAILSSASHLPTTIGRAPGVREIPYDIPVVTGASFPDMIRIMYHRMWENDGQENPPDYPTQS
ncbi:glycoside hydrolase family 76 protein [Moniliophthora roreri MCA 2997]|uniref:Glycoside hydrolase family 76 protein n=2 Tax=Moniliophthora roreri TaxID=221103 RepID=V2XCZ3_MONRO|nr:glycoside hydrolase family 76 protein [Moniliophthora roreri MCA 2997]